MQEFIMQKFWKKYALYWHICTAIIFGIFWAGTYWDQSAAYQTQTKTNTDDIATLKTNLAVMKQEIHDLWKDAGHHE